jgi:hypothetical protein
MSTFETRRQHTNNLLYTNQLFHQKGTVNHWIPIINSPTQHVIQPKIVSQKGSSDM